VGSVASLGSIGEEPDYGSQGARPAAWFMQSDVSHLGMQTLTARRVLTDTGDSGRVLFRRAVYSWAKVQTAATRTEFEGGRRRATR